MALSTNISEGTSYSNFIILATGFLFLIMTANISSAAPTNFSLNVTKQIYWGMEILTTLGTRLDISIMDVYQNDDLSLKVLCNLYDLYRDHTTFLSAIQPDDPLHAEYSSTRFVAWKAMQSACQWTNSSSSSLLPDGCTLESISKTCYTFHFKHLVEFKVKVLLSSDVRVPVISTEWKDENGAPPCAAAIIDSVFD